MTPLNKNLIFIGKILLWLISSYFCGFIIGAIIALDLGNQPTLFLYGFYFSFYYTVFIAAPVFLICTTVYFLKNRKKHFDNKLKSTVLLTMIIGIICTIIMTFLFRINMSTIFYVIILIPTWLGSLLPRLIIPTLKPGRLTK